MPGICIRCVHRMLICYSPFLVVWPSNARTCELCCLAVLESYTSSTCHCISFLEVNLNIRTKYKHNDITLTIKQSIFVQEKCRRLLCDTAHIPDARPCGLISSLQLREPALADWARVQEQSRLHVPPILPPFVQSCWFVQPQDLPTYHGRSPKLTRAVC